MPIASGNHCEDAIMMCLQQLSASCGSLLRGVGRSTVVDVRPLYQSAGVEEKELDVAIRVLVKNHSSCHYNKHGKLLRAEYKRLVRRWKENGRQATNLNNSLTGQVSL